MAKAQRRDSDIRWSIEDSKRIQACHALLTRVCLDLGPKAKGSSKITRALEDVAQCRDTLWHVVGLLPREPVGSEHVMAQLGGRSVLQLVFNSAAQDLKYWDRMRLDRQKRDQQEAERKAREEDDDDD